MVFLVYVNDIVLANPNQTRMHALQQQLQSYFKLKILGDLRFVLGLEIAKSSKGICLCQCKYTLSLLEDTGFMYSKPCNIPMEPNLHLSASEGDLLPDPALYRRLIGLLMYLI